MFNKGYKQTSEHKKKIGEANSKIMKKKWKNIKYKEMMSKAHIDKPTRYWLGKKRPEETIEKIRKASKGKNYSPATQFKKGNTGEKCANWRGGTSFEPYSIDWTRTLRISIRERDNYTCQLCHKKQGDRAFSVHHIDYNKQNSNPENLITLCIACHNKTNHKREKWLNYFKNL